MRQKQPAKPGRWIPPHVCAVCDYDIADLDFFRVIRCPECGSPISVRIAPPMRLYEDFAAAIGFISSFLLVFLLVRGLTDAWPGPGPAAVGVLIVGTMVAISIFGLWIISTRPGPSRVRIAGVLMALAPIILPLAGWLLAAILW